MGQVFTAAGVWLHKTGPGVTASWERSWSNVGVGMLEKPKKSGCVVNDEIKTGQRGENYHMLRYLLPLPGGLRSWLCALSLCW